MANSFDINKFNTFIQQASQTIACGPQCQQNKTSEQLKQKYLNSQTNLASADYQVHMAQKNYVTFTKGELAYNELQDEQLKEKAHLITKAFKTNFDNEIQNLKINIGTYNGLLVNLKNVFELYEKYKRENKELFHELKDDTSDILTNSRKTFYQDQGIQNLDFYYYYILIIIYGVLIICFVLFSFIYPTQLSRKARIGIFILLNFLPFIASKLLGLFLFMAYQLYSLLPKNTHLNM